MKILICGYIGGGNCGDEAICDRLISALKAAGDEVTLLSLSPKESAVLHNTPALPRISPALIDAIRGSDLVILGGGTLLQEQTSKRSPLYYLGIGGLSALLGTPWVLIGGIDPLGGINRWLAEKILPTARVGLMRSEGDLRRLAKLAPHLPRFYLPDCALQPFADCTPPPSPPYRYVVFCPKQGVPRSALAPLAEKHRCRGRRIVWLAMSREDEGECAKWADLFGGVWVAAMPTAFRHPRRVEASAILPDLDRGCAHRYFAAHPCEAACRLIEGAEQVYSARLHGLIFAKKAGTPAHILPDGTKQWKLRGL